MQNSPYLPRSPLGRLGRLVLGCVATAVLLSACASVGDSPVGKALESVGLKSPEVRPETVRQALPTSRKVTLRIHAAEQLNTDAENRSLSVVVRIYKLQRIDTFLTTPYASFINAEAEKAAFGADVKDVREIVLRPGQKHEVVETLGLDVSHLAVVALFRSPAQGRWRFAFDAKQAEASGVTLGLHGCAISVASGTPEQTPPEMLRLAGVQCR